MELARARAIVTGAAGGLGSHFARELARAGAMVAAGDANPAGLRQLAAEAADLPGRLFASRLDVTDEASVAAFAAFAAERLGVPNLLVNNAGIARDGLLVVGEDGAPSAAHAPGNEHAPGNGQGTARSAADVHGSGRGTAVKTLPLAQWRKVLDVNLTGQFLMTRAFAARVVAAGCRDAVVVNLSSIARAGNPGQSNYAASKAGLDACTRTWALELARHGIRVGGVAPGVTETPFLDGFSAEALARLAAGIPLGRLGRPADVWQAVRFIVECDFFTGRTVEVDGGAAMGTL